jgi:hypothetical protein
MIGAFTFAIALNETVAIVFLAFISYLAPKEYLSLIPTRRIDRGVLLFAYLAIPLQYYWAAIDWYGMFIVFVPVWMFLFFPALMALRGETQGYLRAVGTLSWGLMLTVFALSHLAMLLVSGEVPNPVAGGVGLLCSTTWRQYCWGKLLGRHKVTPRVDRGEIVIIFPEGSRGEPEALQAFKKGIGHLAKARPKVPIVPVFVHGLGKALPKGSALLVPFNVLVSVGKTLYGKESYNAFVAELEASMTKLAAEERLCFGSSSLTRG